MPKTNYISNAAKITSCVFMALEHQNCGAGAALECPILEWYHERETRNCRQEATQFQPAVQVGDHAGSGAWGEYGSPDLLRAGHLGHRRMSVHKWWDAVFGRTTDTFAD